MMAGSTTSSVSRGDRCRLNAKTKSEQKRKAFLDALAEMIREGKPIDKAKVCARAGVTPPFVRKHPDLQQALEDAQKKRLASSEGVSRVSSADRGKDRIIEALKRQLDAKQAVIDAKDAALREKDRTVRVLLGKIAANSPLADSELKKELDGAIQRAERAERQVKELQDRIFARRYVRAAGKVDRKWER